mmetsp:Transcript_52574/g.119787  ORF Transcript_52574/g.119787 Transcript_52574/m.119787 type:complete len:300 (-) Transcript_52574:982-1881(-)
MLLSTLNPGDVNALMESLDVDGTGQISRDEILFLEFWHIPQGSVSGIASVTDTITDVTEKQQRRAAKLKHAEDALQRAKQLQSTDEGSDSSAIQECVRIHCILNAASPGAVSKEDFVSAMQNSAQMHAAVSSDQLRGISHSIRSGASKFVTIGEVEGWIKFHLSGDTDSSKLFHKSGLPARQVPKNEVHDYYVDKSELPQLPHLRSPLGGVHSARGAAPPHGDKQSLRSSRGFGMARSELRRTYDPPSPTLQGAARLELLAAAAEAPRIAAAGREDQLRRSFGRPRRQADVMPQPISAK